MFLTERKGTGRSSGSAPAGMTPARGMEAAGRIPCDHRAVPGEAFFRTLPGTSPFRKKATPENFHTFS
ncbi:hypothetical protein SXCC_03578 [Gluconacetobacter sp. SXCC-1]|nr:hypothetical protein SXCC_03578 [Gluconacetobacter sp. SXCC-1]